MQPFHKLCLAAVCLTAVSAATSAHAQTGSVKAIFEKYNLLGNFAWDCNQPPGNDNWYFVNRALGDGNVQRDYMTGATTRLWYMVLDQARETGPNEIYVSGKRENGQAGDGTWKIGPNQMTQIEGTFDGAQVISGGKLLSTGKMLPPLKRCSVPAK